MWQFTKHAFLRMAERGYTRDEILIVLNGDVPSIAYQSPREDTVDIYFGKAGLKFLMIPVDRVARSVITVRPMRKNEKDVYLKEIGG